jgi:hypothetical protein
MWRLVAESVLESRVRPINLKHALRVYSVLMAIFVSTNSSADCVDGIPASTPDSQLIVNLDENGNQNYTISDARTGLMWKQCSEGLHGDGCTEGALADFNWFGALQAPVTLNANGGFAGHTDWRLPNMKELHSIVEKRCVDPAINDTRFPNTLKVGYWSSSPVAQDTRYAWHVYFYDGSALRNLRSSNKHVRLVRGK